MASALKHENGYLLGRLLKNRSLLSALSFVVMRSFGKQRDRVRQSLVMPTISKFSFSFAHKNMVVLYPGNCLKPNTENGESF